MNTVSMLTLQEVKKDYGRFKYWPNPTHKGWILPDPFWTASKIRTLQFPTFGILQCHEEIINDLWWIGLGLQKLDAEVDMEHGGGCFCPRHICGDPKKFLSKHSWGIAIDFNVKDNGYGREPLMDSSIINMFETYGWYWGGHFSTPDGMHFEKGKHEGGD